MTGQEGRDKRTKILEAALAAYARHGIRDATTRQIAGIAGIGKSTIFEYFKNSDELMDAAYAHFIAQSTAQRAKLRQAAARNPSLALAAYFDNLIRQIILEPEKVLLVSQYITAILASGIDFSEVKGHYAQKLQPAANSLLDDFRYIAQAGIASGSFRSVLTSDPWDIAQMLSAVAREMQAQVFEKEESVIRETCLRLKRMAFRMLGVILES
jgi:AcrR family transcriptional regulator